MANPFIGHGYYVENGTVTTGNELATLPATNLQSMQPSKRWRTSGVSNAWVQVDLGSAKAIDFAAIISHNGAAADTWQIRASSDGTPATVPDYDSGSQNLFPAATRPSEAWRTHYDSHYVFASTQTWRYWRCDFTIAGSYFEAGVLLLGLRQQITLAYPFSRGYAPADIVEITPDGGAVTDPRGRPRAWNFMVNLLDETTEMAIDGLDALRGIGDAVYCVENPDATTWLHRQSLYGLIAQATPLDRPDYGIREKRYYLRELI